MAEPRLEELRAEARYARERRDLYRAMMYSQRRASPTRMKELDQISLSAQGRLLRAEHAEATKAGAVTYKKPKAAGA